MVFAPNALEMHRHGLAVLPIGRDRQPLVSGFNRWRSRPNEKTIATWIEKHPNSNIAVHPGLSDVVVVDVDDVAHDGDVEQLLGDTPLKVRTRRGLHRYYRATGERLLGKLDAFGLRVDVKAGNAIVIAPPSVHESGHVYALEGDWSLVQSLPSLKPGGLRHLQSKPAAVPDSMRDGSRGQWLNDQMCARFHKCDNFAQLLALAHDLNQQLGIIANNPLDETEVVKRAREVWRAVESGKLMPLSRFQGTLKTSIHELDCLVARSSRHGPDALALLLKLRHAHSSRCARGQTFSITPRRMAENGVFPGWTKGRFEKARDVLLDAGMVLKVESFRQKVRKAAQYMLAEFAANCKKSAAGLGGGR